MVTLQAKQQPPSLQQQQHHQQQQPTQQIQCQYEQVAEEETWNGLQNQLTCDNNVGNNQNGRREVNFRNDRPILNNLKSNNKEENSERRVDEVDNFGGESTSSRSKKDARNCTEDTGSNVQNGYREVDFREDWSITNSLKRNNKEENCERRTDVVRNFGGESTSSRSKEDARNCTQETGSNVQNGRREVDFRKDWSITNNLKGNDKEENREWRFAEVANFGEEPTSSWLGKYTRNSTEEAGSNNQNGRRKVDFRGDWPISNNLNTHSEEDSREKKVGEVANFAGETKSSRLGKDTRICTEEAGSKKQNDHREVDFRDDWSMTNNLKSNNKVDNRERRVAAVENFTEETTSSRSGKDGESTQCSDIEDDDDVEIGEELEEEDEDDGGDNYQVDEVDSEDDEDDDEDDKGPGNQIEKSDGWIKKKVVTTRVQHQTSFAEGYGQSEVIPQMDETTFGEVSITNSKHVHVGNTNFYKGPVTIKQFVYTNAYPVLDKEDDTEGSASARVSDINPNIVPIVKCDPKGPILPSYQDYDTVTKWLWTWRCAAILCVVALILVTLVAVISVLLTKSDVPPRLPNKLPDSPNSGNDGNELPTSVRIVDREFWNAQPPAKQLDKLEESPTPFVIISHTATTPCETHSSCVLRVRRIQTLHIESFGWDDIGYNFLIGGDGLVYTGRSWDLAGAHAFGYNYKSMGISFIGTFNDVEPNTLQLNAAQKLIEYGVNETKITRDYKLLGHRQVSKTLSPGDQLYNILQTWDHWSPIPRPESMGGAKAVKPHPAVVLLLLIIIFPHPLQIVQLSSRILFRAARTLCNFAIIYVQ